MVRLIGRRRGCGGGLGFNNDRLSDGCDNLDFNLVHLSDYRQPRPRAIGEQTWLRLNQTEAERVTGRILAAQWATAVLCVLAICVILVFWGPVA